MEEVESIQKRLGGDVGDVRQALFTLRLELAGYRSVGESYQDSDREERPEHEEAQDPPRDARPQELHAHQAQ